MIDEQIKSDLYLLLRKMNLISPDMNDVFNDLDNEIQRMKVIKLLRRNRYALLDEIHYKQKLLDNLDFTINILKNARKDFI